VNKLTCTCRYPDQSQRYENTNEVQEAEQLFEIWYMGQLHKSTREVQVQKYRSTEVTDTAIRVAFLSHSYSQVRPAETGVSQLSFSSNTVLPTPHAVVGCEGNSDNQICKGSKTSGAKTSSSPELSQLDKSTSKVQEAEQLFEKRNTGQLHKISREVQEQVQKRLIQP